MPRRATRLRCSYREGRHQCQRLGRGDPPLCDIHELIEEEDYDEEILETVRDAIADGVSQLADALQDVFGRVLQPRPAHRPDGWPKMPPPEQKRARNGKKTPPPPPQPEPPPAVDHTDPREILGFEPGQKLTRELVKARQRDLAKILHPDKGGASRAFARMNLAAKALLDELS